MNYKSALILFCITFFLKLGAAFYFAEAGRCSAADVPQAYIYPVGGISFAGGDTFSYLGAIDNLIEKNEYFFESGDRKVYAGRMPYYGVPYYLLRLLFDKFTAADLTVVLQIFFSSLAAVCLARLCFEMTKSIWCFWVGFLLYVLSFNLFALDLLLIPESLALSFTVFLLYFCRQYRVNKKTTAFFAASAMLTVLTLLKPYFVLLYPVLYLEYAAVKGIFTAFDRKNLTDFIVKSAASGLILVILLLPWAVRNYMVTGKIIFSQENVYAGYDYKESELAFRRFTAAWGGDFVGLNPQSSNPTNYFLKEFSAAHDRLKLPPTAFADGYSAADVENVRRAYLRLQENYSPELDASVAAQFDRLTMIYRSERPLMYYAGSGFVAAKRLILHTNSEFLMSFINAESSCYRPWQTVFRIVNALIYLFSLVFGLAGCGIFSVKNRMSIMFAAVPVFLIGYFAFYDGYASARYFVPAFPVLLTGAVFVLHYLQSKQKHFAESRKIC